jgi:hypothetical protein
MKEIKFGIKIRFMISIEIDYQSSKKKWGIKLNFSNEIQSYYLFYLCFLF